MTNENNVSVPFNATLPQPTIPPQPPQPPQQIQQQVQQQVQQQQQQQQQQQPPQQIQQQQQQQQQQQPPQQIQQPALQAYADENGNVHVPVNGKISVTENSSAYDMIIAQQQAQIDALIAQNSSLAQQVTQMVQNGAQFQQAQPQMLPNQTQFNLQALSDDKDYSLEGLAEQIGKRNR